MSDKIKTVCTNLFREIRAKHSDQLPRIDKWVAANFEQSNLALFLTKGDDEDRKKLCVLLKKAIDNKDFSAFDPDAKPPEENNSKEEKPEPEPESKPKEQTEPKKEQQKSEPKADKPAPEPKGEPAKTEPPKKSGTTLDSMVATIAGAVFNKKAPTLIDKVIEKLGGTPKGESISEERINEIVDERINERFKKILGE